MALALRESATSPGSRPGTVEEREALAVLRPPNDDGAVVSRQRAVAAQVEHDVVGDVHGQEMGRGRMPAAVRRRSHPGRRLCADAAHEAGDGGRIRGARGWGGGPRDDDVVAACPAPATPLGYSPVLAGVGGVGEAGAAEWEYSRATPRMEKQ